MNLNNPLCATSYGNVGFGDCFLEPGKIKGAIQVPASFEIAESDIADLQDFLEEKTSAVIGTRIFPYHNFINITDGTEDVSITTTDYGAKYITRDGFYDFTFRYLKGGVQLHQEIAKNAGSGKYFLFYDDNGVLYGYKSGGKLKGIPTDIFYVKPWGMNTGADQANYLLRFIIDPVYMNKGNLGFVKVTTFNFFDIVGLQEVEISLVSLTNNTAVVKLHSKISKVDMYDTYSTNFAQTTAWLSENEDRVAVPVTVATVNTTEKGWNLTFSPGLFSGSDKVFLKTAIASVLSQSPISVSGFEGSEALEIEAPNS